MSKSLIQSEWSEGRKVDGPSRRRSRENGLSVQQLVILSFTMVLCRKVDGRERSLQLIGILEAVHFHQKDRPVEVFGLGSNLGTF